MPNTYVLITSNVLSSTATSVTLSSIPSTYTDLVLKASVRTNTVNNGDYLVVRPNAGTTNFSQRYIWVTGSSVGSSSDTQFYGPVNGSGASSTTNTFGSFEMYIPNYTLSANKPLFIHSAYETDSSTTEQYIVAGLSRNTAAISSLQILPYYNQGTTVFQVGTSFYLYGIKNS